MVTKVDRLLHSGLLLMVAMVGLIIILQEPLMAGQVAPGVELVVCARVKVALMVPMALPHLMVPGERAKALLHESSGKLLVNFMLVVGEAVVITTQATPIQTLQVAKAGEEMAGIGPMVLQVLPIPAVEAVVGVLLQEAHPRGKAGLAALALCA